MLLGVLSASLSADWQSILPIRQSFNIWVHPPARSFVNKAGGKGDCSDNLNAAAPSSGKGDEDAVKISCVSKMYPTAVICLLWARDSFSVACRFWLPCHISKKSWTLAILCNILSSATLLISDSFSVFIVSDAGSLPPNVLWLARANYLTRTVLRMVSPLLFDYLQLITCHPREKLASTLTPWGMIENMSCATLERSA